MKNILFATAFVFICLSAKAQVVQVKDLSSSVGSWEGQSSYLDYSSGKPFTELANTKIVLKADYRGYAMGCEYPKESDHKTVNSLSKYPKEIAEIIFSKYKDFPNNTQLSIALIENGKVSYYGLIKEKDTIKPAENQKKIFEIGSITKVFTSTILASLVENKKINLTDEINSYYSFAFKDNIKINFESLANHTSGLPRLSMSKNAVDVNYVNTLTAKKPTILAINYTNPWVIDEIYNDNTMKNIKGVIATFGTTNEALLDIVLGKCNPTGKMPFTTPVSEAAVDKQLSDVPGYMKGKEYGLFKFDEGLGYK